MSCTGLPYAEPNTASVTTAMSFPDLSYTEPNTTSNTTASLGAIPKYTHSENKDGKVRWKWNYAYYLNLEELFDPNDRAVLVERGRYNLGYRSNWKPTKMLEFDKNELIQLYSNLRGTQDKFRVAIQHNENAISSKLVVRQFIANSIINGVTGIFVSDKLDVMLEMYFDVCSMLYVQGYHNQIEHELIRYYPYSPDIKSTDDVYNLPTFKWLFITTDRLFIDATNLLSTYATVENNQIITKKRDILLGLNVDMDITRQVYKSGTVKNVLNNIEFKNEIRNYTSFINNQPDNDNEPQKLLALYRQVKSNYDVMSGVDMAAPWSYYEEKVKSSISRLLLLSASHCLEKLKELSSNEKQYSFWNDEKGNDINYHYNFKWLMPFDFERIFSFCQNGYPVEEVVKAPNYIGWSYLRLYYENNTSGKKSTEQTTKEEKCKPNNININNSNMLMKALLKI